MPKLIRPLFWLSSLVIVLGLTGCAQLTPPSRHSPPTNSSTSHSLPTAPTTSPVPTTSTASAQWIPASQVASVAGNLIATASSPCVIQLEMYELGNQALISALEAAGTRGCSVQIELDSTESQSQNALRQLQGHKGISVETATIPGGIDHVKALVINRGATALVGGVNWGQSSSYTNDADVLLANDPLLSARLSADWSNRTASFTGGVTSTMELAGPAIQNYALGLLNDAQGRILVLANYLTEYTLQDALAAAAGRGDTVDVLLNPSGYGATSAATWLSQHGVHVRYAQTNPYLHAKVILTSTGGMVGSANFSYDGTHVNRELDVGIPSSVLSSAWNWGTALWNEGSPA